MNVTVNLKEKESRNKGITLIALVITIIVLLILAGISIAMLTGDNGILNKATTAKEETEIAELIELARTEILAVQIENEGNINKNQFIEILNKFFEKETIPTKEDLPEDLSSAEQKVTAKQEYKNHKIKLSDIWNGTLQEEPLILPPFNPEELTIGEPLNVDMYGMKVGKYTVQGPRMNTNVWRLFYQDQNYTYIITDELLGDDVEYVPANHYDNYKNGATVSVVGQKLNQKITALFVDSNTNANIRSTAWLTDPKEWETYENSDSVFCIGSPTLELLVKSYNSKSEGKSTIELTGGNIGYFVTQSFLQKLNPSDRNGIYNKGETKICLLSSPVQSSSIPERIPYVSPDGMIEAFCSTGDQGAIRPIVCIPTIVFNRRYLSSLS